MSRERKTMIKINEIALPIDYNDEQLKEIVAKKLGCDKKEITKIVLLKKSLDARKKSNIHYVVSPAVEISDSKILRKNIKNNKIEEYTAPLGVYIPDCSVKLKPVIAGFGPAGIFAALYLARSGARPIVLERGLDVDKRKKKTDFFHSGGDLDEECNVQFGEGGAGAFSDGKLNTGTHSHLIASVLKDLADFGAPPEITYLSKPHIGTDKLLQVVKNLREEIKRLGGKVIFGARLVDFSVKNRAVSSVSYIKDGKIFEIETSGLILATGHSARDIFELMLKKDIEITQKAFSLGMRIEHLQSDLNISMYGENAPLDLLAPSDYRLATHLSNSRGVYSFCMCPGGSVIASASEKNTIVTNGMSYHSRSGKNANSAILVGVTPKDFNTSDPLEGVFLQRKIEEAAFKAAGGGYKAPCTSVGLLLKKTSVFEIGRITPTYKPGTVYADPREYLPEYVTDALKEAIPIFAKKISCFNDSDAILTGPETRSSSPVRITRNEKLESVSIKRLYPCGEGAGYAGGIVSSAVDGIKCALAAIEGCRE